MVADQSPVWAKAWGSRCAIRHDPGVQVKVVRTPSGGHLRLARSRVVDGRDERCRGLDAHEDRGLDPGWVNAALGVEVKDAVKQLTVGHDAGLPLETVSLAGNRVYNIDLHARISGQVCHRAR